MRQVDDGRRARDIASKDEAGSLAERGERNPSLWREQNGARSLSRCGQNLLGGALAPLLESTALRRLRTIRQLGFVNRVWPQATHTRYEHSLGCYRLARRAIAQLQATFPPHPPALFSREHIQTFLVAVLLHDIGHYPFSHSLDGLRSLLPTHEQVGRELIERSQLATILERDYHLAPARVADLIDPPTETEDFPCAAHPLRPLLDGPCDVDKLDYVARDASSCGFSAGAAHSVPLLRALRFHWLDRQKQFRLVLSALALAALRGWVHLRHVLYRYVYWHPVNRACAAMLTRAVQDALEARALSACSLRDMDDAELLDRLSAPTMPASTRQLVRLLRDTHVYQPAIEIKQDTALFDSLLILTQDAARRKRVELRLVSALAQHFQMDIEEHALLLDIVRPKNWELDGWVVFPPPPGGLAACVPWSQALGLTPEDLRRTARPSCQPRVLVVPHLFFCLLGHTNDVLFPLLEQTIQEMREEEESCERNS
jgi:HD superfamily phosphohydrolase